MARMQRPFDPERSFDGESGYAFTAPVGRFLPNAFGVHDMLGNVWEWTGDCWNEDLNGIPNDGSERTTGDCGRRVLRGGSWYDDAGYVRAGNRVWDDAGNRVSGAGFRVSGAGFRVARTLFYPES
jgi:formylglycine-generating enzyme required for sulfatase activity